ncbi:MULTISPECIES: hypothetical protein [unclassified Mycolicibacterium]|uniref:hypothetical protein n=1 Tax=unclassified Mycolicibacterium TaxID=2636767 RepID=UPI00192E4035|nr:MULTISPECIES: hypothetical protein [unclassified Mycolicibacterium]
MSRGQSELTEYLGLSSKGIGIVGRLLEHHFAVAERRGVLAVIEQQVDEMQTKRAVGGVGTYRAVYRGKYLWVYGHAAILPNTSRLVHDKGRSPARIVHKSLEISGGG